ncbi:MAG: hypothetical protein GC157_15200 [Frankiales bacterium]|nr:hypothetical protein [Frankiales bacterium]
MISRQAKEYGAALGLRGRQGYVRGRGSVLGEVDADVVTAAFGFWPADVVREAWEGGRAVVDVATAVTAYADVCRDWGRTRLGATRDPGRLAELLATVVDGLDVAGLPLFAGWRAVPLPDDDLGRAAQLMHVLREHRGGLHLVAVIATGLTPLQAILAGPGAAALQNALQGGGGSGNAAFYGWEEPFEDASAHVAARADAESLTDRLVAPAYDALGHDERVELLDLLRSAATSAAAPH